MNPTYLFTVTGSNHQEIMAEAHRVAVDYWGGRSQYKITEVEVDGDTFLQLGGNRPLMRAAVTTRAVTEVAG